MIFVTLGTQKQQFTRIIDYVVNSEELKTEKIFIQAGRTVYYKGYDENRIQIANFITKEEMEEWTDKADIIVAHGGVGSIFPALIKGKKVIAVPRLKKYKEHVDDHQIEVCEELAKMNHIICFMPEEDTVGTLKKFDESIRILKSTEFEKYISNSDYIAILEKEI